MYTFYVIGFILAAIFGTIILLAKVEERRLEREKIMTAGK
jgi:hypothetical protein